MVPESYTEFFLATAGAGAAFIGLLFVAISIHPQFAFRDLVPDGAPRQYLAEATLYTLANGFIVSCVALIPDVDVGWVAVPSGLWGLGAAAWLVVLLDRAHRHGRAADWPHRLRVTSLSLVGIALYAGEIGFGVRLIGRPQAASDWRGLALIILGLYALGMARAWTLLGDPRQGVSGWLNPLRDRSVHGERDSPDDVACETDSAADPSTQVRTVRPRPVAAVVGARSMATSNPTAFASLSRRSNEKRSRRPRSRSDTRG